MSLRLLGAILVAGVLGWPQQAAAHELSPYEKESIEIALHRAGGEVDPAPDRKVIEDVVIVPLDVIEPRDPLPSFGNWFHATSRPSVIRRELLLRVGDRYDARLAEESERNLRVRQLSVVLVVPLKGSEDDTVRLLVVTKDVWSLRLNWEPTFVNGSLQSLYLQPSEENLFGQHKTANASVLLGRMTYSLGLGFVDPRIGGSRLLGAASASVIFNCESGGVEGSRGSFQYGKPLYSNRTKWGWAVAALWDDEIVRPAGTVGQSICNGRRAVGLDFVATPKIDDIPYQYRQDVFRSQISAVRSFGLEEKNDVSFGLEADRGEFIPPDMFGQPIVVRRDFDKLLPVSDTRLSPFVQLHSYENRFLRVLDFETLGLQEDYRIGYDLWARLYPALEAVGSSRNLLGMYGGASYTLPVSNGLANAYVASSYELSKPETTDGAVITGGRFVTPRLPFGRVVLDGYLLDRFDNYLNPSHSLGGTTRLRGYRTQAFVGPNVLVGNIEVRSPPFELWSVQIGAVAFFDAGDAFRDFSEISVKRGVGGGLRFLFPQVDRVVFRVDVGIPLNPSDPAAETTVIAQFYQAFSMPELSAPALVPTGAVQRTLSSSSGQ